MKNPSKSKPKTKSCDGYDNGWPPNTTKYPKATKPSQGAYPFQMPPQPITPKSGAYPMPMPGVAKSSKKK